MSAMRDISDIAILGFADAVSHRRCGTFIVVGSFDAWRAETRAQREQCDIEPIGG